MNSLDFKKCLENKKIKPFPKGKILVSKELEIAKNDCQSSKVGKPKCVSKRSFDKMIVGCAMSNYIQ